MPSFQKDAQRTPFGKNVYLRSTRGLRFEHGTLAESTVPEVEIDGVVSKFIQPGTGLARITSGDELDKVGPVDQAATDGRQTEANFVGICDTFLPWQLLYRDVEVAFVVDAEVVQAKCFEVNDTQDGYKAMTNTTAAALVGQKHVNITFGRASTEL